MTIGIALKYDTGVVLGSDSQVTLGDAPYKTQGTKIEQIGNRVGLIAAGSIDFYKELVRRLHNHREEIDKLDIPTVTDLVSQTMSELYMTLAQRFGKRGVEEVVPLASVGMLVAGMDENGKTNVFTLRPPGIYGPEDNYGIVGSGIFYAGMILKKGYGLDMTFENAPRLVTRAIKETAEMDPYVGGKIRLALVESNPKLMGGPFHAGWDEFYLSKYLSEIEGEDVVINALLGGSIPDDPELKGFVSDAISLAYNVSRHLEERRRRFGV